MKHLLRISFVSLLLFTFLSFPRSVDATVIVGEVNNYGKTYLNYFMNHDYIKRDKPYLYNFSVKALEGARMKLVAKGKLDDIWVVFEIPSTVAILESEDSFIEKRSECRISGGDSIIFEPTKLENCYRIYIVDEIRYDTLLKYLISLQELRQEGERISSNNLSGYELTNYLGSIFYSVPVWSLDSRYVSFGAWLDGDVHYEVYDVRSEKYLKSEKLDSTMATEPIWSSDSRYLFYASLDQIKIFDTENESTRSIDLTGLTNSRNLETLLSFDPTTKRLIFAYDTNALFSYNVYEYDIETQELDLVASDVNYLSWQKEGSSANILYKRLTSPDGRWEAIVTDDINGDTRSVKKIVENSEVETTGNVDYIRQSKKSKDRVRDKLIVWFIILLIGSLMIGFALGAIFVRTKTKGENDRQIPNHNLDSDFQKGSKK